MTPPMLYDPRKLKLVEENSSGDENSPSATTATVKESINNIAEITPTKLPVLNAPTAATKPNSLPATITSIDVDSAAGIVDLIHATIGTVGKIYALCLFSYRHCVSCNSIIMHILFSLHTDVAASDDVVQEPVAKKVKTEEEPVVQEPVAKKVKTEEEPDVPSPSKPPLPQVYKLRRLESNVIDTFVPSGANSGKSCIKVLALDSHYVGIDLQQGTKPAYMEPVRKYLIRDPIKASNEFRFVDVLYACEPNHPETVKKDPTQSSFFPWRVFIVHKKNEETLQDLQKDIVERLTHYANTHHGEGEDQFKYLPEFCTGSIENNPHLPWNYYIQNKSVLRFMKRCYPGYSRHEIVAAPDALIRFFGSTEEGTRQLTMSDADWGKL